MVLMLLLLVPLLAGLLCLVTQSRVWWERLNLLAFAIVAALAAILGFDVIACGSGLRPRRFPPGRCPERAW